MSLIEELVARQNLLVERNTAVMSSLEKAIAGGPDGRNLVTPYDTNIRTQEIDLTSAVTNLEVAAGNCNWIQALSDGPLVGISIRIGTPDGKEFKLNEVVVIPVKNPVKIYLTSEVRAGRSFVRMYFITGPSPLGMNLSGETAIVSRAEQAVRAGSFNTYDRRGEVFWQENFEDGLSKWDSNISGAGASVALSVARAHTGSTSVKLVAGSDGNRYAELTRPVAVPKIANVIGFEMAWSGDSNVEETQFLVTAYTGTLVLYWGIRTIIATGQVAILTGSGTWTDVGTAIVPYMDTLNFIQFKFVVEYTTLAYKRLLIGPFEIDVKGYKGYYGASAEVGRIHLTGRNIGTAGTNAAAYADNFIITQNEPI